MFREKGGISHYVKQWPLGLKNEISPQLKSEC